jgi:hypothetical protein
MPPAAMPALHELQAAFAAAILRDEASPLAESVRADGIAAERRIQVYRNNSLITLTAALQATFPVVCRLVDERFFAFAAQAFIRAAPPRAPRLAEYGAGFADFLAGFAPAAGLPYLPDVARLEWLIARAFHAADATPLDPGRLATLPPESQAAAALLPHPSAGLLASPFPVEALWQANQPGRDGSGVALEAGPCRLLVHRRADEVEMMRLDAPGHALAAALLAGAPLGDALAAALAEDAGFDPGPVLGRLLGRGVFTDLATPA